MYGVDRQVVRAVVSGSSGELDTALEAERAALFPDPSDDARFATVVCTFSQWLAGEQTGSIDPVILAALARETASATLPADRADFLKLIEQALQLQPSPGADHPTR